MATGWNEDGQLGNGKFSLYSLTFIQVISDVTKALAAGRSHSFVLKEDGSVWVTGTNAHGQFGDGSTTSRWEIIFVRVIDALQNRNGVWVTMLP